MLLDLLLAEVAVERIRDIEKTTVLVRKTKLPDQRRMALRSRHYSRKTEQGLLGHSLHEIEVSIL